MEFKNKYYIMRHGQAVSNVKEICSSLPEKFENPLTDIGKKTAKESVQKLKEKLVGQGKKIDLIFSSPLLRTRQTAEIAGEVLGERPIADERLREIRFGEFNGKNLHEMWASFEREEDRIYKGADGGESYVEILDRMKATIEDIEKKHEDKSVLLISHEGPSFLLQGWFNGLSIEETIENSPAGERIHKAEIRELN